MSKIIPEFREIKLDDISVLEQRLKEVEEELPLIKSYPSQIQIRSQKTKWSSCTKRDNLTFNIYLAALPERLREYIIIHEATHLKEKNHGKKF